MKIVIWFFLSVFSTISTTSTTLTPNFYKGLCPEAEVIVRNLTWNVVSTKPTMAAKLLRMHYHDCFVRGCEGSVLLDSKDKTSEKNSVVNFFLSGFDFIDEVKGALEAKCPGVVSCADIIALVARDSVSFQFGRPLWEVFTGRRDGLNSFSDEATNELPSPFFNFTDLKKNFEQKGLNVRDLVILSGAHTIGMAPCGAFSNRLSPLDPTMHPTFASMLNKTCGSRQLVNVSLDSTGTIFDSHYYVAIKQKEGLLTSDASLLSDEEAGHIVEELIDEATFFGEFGKAMQKMGAIGVLTGEEGEVRRACRKINSHDDSAADTSGVFIACFLLFLCFLIEAMLGLFRFSC